MVPETLGFNLTGSRGGGAGEKEGAMGKKANPTHRDGAEQERNNLLWGDLRLHFWAIPSRSHEAVLC